MSEVSTGVCGQKRSEQKSLSVSVGGPAPVYMPREAQRVPCMGRVQSGDARATVALLADLTRNDESRTR